MKDLEVVGNDEDQSLIKLVKLFITSTKNNIILGKKILIIDDDAYEDFKEYVIIENTPSSIRITSLEHKGLLSSQYPYLKISIGTYNIELQPIFSYPIIRPMDIIPAAGDFVLTQMDPGLVPCVLEPPWIKRCGFGIKFTDEINVIDSINSGKIEEIPNEPKSEKRREINP